MAKQKFEHNQLVSHPNSGGSYIRNPDGSLTQSEPATEVALPEAGEPVSEAAADQPEQE